MKVTIEIHGSLLKYLLTSAGQHNMPIGEAAGRLIRLGVLAEKMERQKVARITRKASKVNRVKRKKAG